MTRGPRTQYHSAMETLPDPLPGNPLAVVADWLRDAERDAAQPNPNAMVLATADAQGRPSARIVLCKDIDPAAGTISFYTNYRSRKGRELDANPHAAIVFHWDHRHRQVRAEGRVERLPASDNDRYFRSRPWQSRLGAWASHQSEPVESRSALIAAVGSTAQRFGIPYGGPGTPEPQSIATEVPRPEHWGGYRLCLEALELWVEGDFRIHDRARWTRSASGGWQATRLQP